MLVQRMTRTAADSTVIELVTAYDYDANDRLEQENGPEGIVTYTYDANGNTLEKQTNGLTDTTYAYDRQDRLIQADTPTATLTYTYDAMGVRQSKTENGLTTNFLVDANRDYAQVIEEQGPTDSIIYLRGDDLISQASAGITSTYHADGQGSTKALSSAAGAPTDRFIYTPYGELEHREGTTQSDFLYTGEQFEAGLGFYYLRARYYNPANGRFPTMDTYQGRVGEPQTLHKYLYVHADPINNIDPSGNITLGGISTSINIQATLTRSAVGLTARTFVNRAVTAGVQSFRIAISEARRCVRHPKRCRLTVPILVVGTETPKTAEHIQDAQLGKGSNLVMSPFWLTRKSPPNSRSWLRRAAPCRNKVPGVTSCDEYPFASTHEGGRNNFARVSLRPVPVGEQSIQGGV